MGGLPKTFNAQGSRRKSAGDADPARRRRNGRITSLAIALACLSLAIWLMTTPNTGQALLVASLTDFGMSALFLAFSVAYLCWSVPALARRAQHRLALEQLPAGVLNAAAWSFTKGDTSLRLAYLLAFLLLANLWAGGHTQVLVIWLLASLFAVGALPKDRYLMGPSPQASATRKIILGLAGLISALILINGFRTVQQCDCSLSEELPLMAEALLNSLALFAGGHLIMKLGDPWIAKRWNVMRSRPAPRT